MFTDGLAGGPGIAYRLFSLPGPGRTDSVYRWFGRGPRNSLYAVFIAGPWLDRQCFSRDTYINKMNFR